MAELKRNFSDPKMNKDMDERILPSGQYRDALNVQVATSDGSDVGSLQTLLGNVEVTDNVVPEDYSTCVGVLNLPEKDLIYYFVAGGGKKGYEPLAKKDYIIEYDTNSKTTKYVFVDIYSVTHTISGDQAGALYFDITTTASYNNLGIRIGMELKGVLNDPNGSGQNQVGINNNWGVKVTDIKRVGTSPNKYRIYHSGSSGLLLNGSAFYCTDGDVMTFTAERVLKFQYNNYITAINYLDGMIFWTDGDNEPRKISIERSLRGTGGEVPLQGWNETLATSLQVTNENTFPNSQNNADFHTRLTRQGDNGSGFVVARNRRHTYPEWVKEKDITVIKRNPMAPLELEMLTTEAKRIPNVNSGNTTPNQIFSSITTAFGDADGSYEVGTQLTNLNFDDPVDYRAGDIILFTNDPNANPSDFADSESVVRLKCTSGPSGMPNNGGSTGPYDFTVLAADVNLGSSSELWFSRLEQAKPLFEYKFPRFSYRWKYTDGEYSTFAPWSRVAFLPGDFDYMPKKGFNLGMTNRLRYLRLKNYFMEFSLVPSDVVQVDLLYKEDGKPTVYTVKEITRKDGAPMWPDTKTSNYNRGKFEIETEMIHAVVPSNQMLRPWDNVPRTAKAQTMSGNRLIYGNYKQNYTIDKGLKLNVFHSAYTIPESAQEDYEIGMTSLKSLRTYQVGVVWIDDWGRESPVMVPVEGGSITIEKKDCVKQNKLRAKILEKHNGGFDPPSWARYMKYYVKETSNEYYNVAMDRFYDAEDGNVWLSFPSAERNKIDVNTYLILKKQHNNANAVSDLARYKCIAVSNEAPLFIKKKRKSYGMAKVEYAPQGLPEPNRTFVMVLKSEFDANFSGVYKPDLKDNLQLRVAGISGIDIISSELYNIVGIAEASSPSGYNKITIDKPLGQEVTPLPSLDRTLHLRVEIVENKFEDRPEFDGRFFVKILKDLTLEKELLSTFTSRFIYNVVDTMQVGLCQSHRGASESHWEDFKDNHKGAYNTDKCRWFIDDMDTAHDTSGYTNKIKASEINSGGMYNWPQANFPYVGDAGAFGYMDLSYSSYTSDGVSLSHGFDPAWDRLKQVDTLFRWKSDPAQTVYKITGRKGRLGFGGAGVGLNCRLFTGSSSSSTGPRGGYWVSGSWVSENSHASGSPLIGGNGDYRWNYNGSGTSAYAGSGGNDNQRFSVRIRVDKMWGSGPNHIFDEATMAPQYYNDPATGELVYLQTGDKYGEAVCEGTGPGGNTYGFGHEHNWYPFTSYTRTKRNASNQLVEETVYQTSGMNWEGINSSGGWNQSQYSPCYDPQANLGASGLQTIGLKGWEDYERMVQTLEFLEPQLITEDSSTAGFLTNNPAIWETEPKEDVGLDIYYEASGAIPLNPTADDNELLIPCFSKFTWAGQTYKIASVNSYAAADFITKLTVFGNLATAIPHDQYLKIERYDGSCIMVFVNTPGGAAAASGQNTIYITTGDNSINLGTFVNTADRAPHHNPTTLSFFNCWAFGNGVESDRVRDDFNAPQIANGVKASTTLAEPYAEEIRSSGLIFSGIFNSTSGVNDLNQFIQAEPITKDLNPSYGTLQHLVARNTDTLAFCEDKVLRILTNKDALFNADGNSNVTSNAMVLGQATPIQGEFGISTNPESLAETPAGFYWVDQMRGQVLHLAGTNIISISDIGMKDYFNDNLKDLDSVKGTYDDKKKEYNVTLGKKNSNQQFRSTGTTLSFSQLSKGWSSFKSFIPEAGTSMNNEYYTWNQGSMWQHHSESGVRNKFYGTQYTSDVTLIFNDQPGSVKSFGTINYEGTQARITAFTTESVTNASNQTFNITDKEYYDLWAKTGWYVDSITTNLQEVDDLEFKDKEGKWFSTIQGKTTELSNLDEREFSVQGLGNATSETTGNPSTPVKLYVQPSTQSTSGTNWDSAGADNPDWGVTNSTALIANTGATVTAGSNTATITNITYNAGGGVPQYSGLDLDAKDFSTPGGTATTSGSGNSTTYIYTKPGSGSWNADPEVEKVEFTNNGIAGDPGNTVNCKIYYNNFTMPNAGNKTIYADVDGPSTNVRGRVFRDTCLKVNYIEYISGNSASFPDNHATVTQTDMAGVTETAMVNWRPDPWTTHKHVVDAGAEEGLTTKMAEYTITADSDYYLTEVNNTGYGVEAIYQTSIYNSMYETAYSYTYTNTYHTSSGNTNKIASTKVEIFYTPPTGPGWENGDLVSAEGGFCALLHAVDLDYLVRPINSGTAKTSSGGDQLQNAFVNNSHLAVSGGLQTVTLNASGPGKVGLIFLEKGTGEGGADKHGTLALTTASSKGVTHGSGYTLTYGTSAVTNIVDLVAGVNEIVVPVPTPTSTLKTYNIYCVVSTGEGTHLALKSGTPIATSPIVYTTQTNTASTISITAPTNATSNIASVSGFAGKPGTSLKESSIRRRVSFTLTASVVDSVQKQFTITRQPLLEDLLGGTNSYPLTVAKSSGNQLLVSALHGAGISTGMTVKYPQGGTSVIPSGTTVTNKTTSGGTTTLTISNSIGGSLSVGDKIEFGNGWKFSHDLTVAYAKKIVQTTTSGVTLTQESDDRTKLIVSGKITCAAIGNPGAGNLTLKLDNITTVS